MGGGASKTPPAAKAADQLFKEFDVNEDGKVDFEEFALSVAKLVRGDGPINLMGSNCVGYVGSKDEREDDSEDKEEGETEDEGMETEKEVAENGDKSKTTPVMVVDQGTGLKIRLTGRNNKIHTHVGGCLHVYSNG